MKIVARWLIALLVLSALGGLGFHFKEDVERRIAEYLQSDEEDPVPTFTLRRQDYEVTVSVEGELSGLQTTAVSSPRVRTGPLKIAWLFPEGELAREGDVVVRFHSTEALLSLEQNQNRLASYGHQMSKAETDLQSQETLYGLDRDSAEKEMEFAHNQVRKDEDIFPLWEIQESIMSAALAKYRKETVESRAGLQRNLSQADLKILGIENTRAKMEVLRAEETLSSLEVASPVEGVVIYKRMGFEEIQAGQDAWPGQPLLDVASISQFQATARVVENDIAGVELGKRATVSVRGIPGRVFSGRVSSIDGVANQIDNRDPRKYFTVGILLDVPVDLMSDLKPGMAIQATVQSGSWPDALAVPKSAVFKKEAGFSAYFAQDDDYIERAVQVIDSDHGFYIIGGAQEGERICLRHPFEKQRLQLPDFSAPSMATQTRRFTVRYR
jgi:HlyD family secretion protein